ncbi:MAG: DUF177 domain-containing protein [Niabella sp.]
MMHRREYDIAFVGLKPGIHEFNYEIKDKFFEAFQQQDFTNSNATVKLTLDKKSSFMLLKFEIGGTLDVICDRCGSDLTLNLWDEFHVTVKMVEEPDLMNDQEEDPDVYYIGRQESHINTENWVYEFVNLSIPMHKVCGSAGTDGKDCDPKVLEMLKKLEGEEKETPVQNPIWKGLEQFKKPKK